MKKLAVTVRQILHGLVFTLKHICPQFVFVLFLVTAPAWSAGTDAVASNPLQFQCRRVKLQWCNISYPTPVLLHDISQHRGNNVYGNRGSHWGMQMRTIDRALHIQHQRVVESIGDGHHSFRHSTGQCEKLYKNFLCYHTFPACQSVKKDGHPGRLYHVCRELCEFTKECGFPVKRL